MSERKRAIASWFQEISALLMVFPLLEYIWLEKAIRWDLAIAAWTIALVSMIYAICQHGPPSRFMFIIGVSAFVIGVIVGICAFVYMEIKHKKHHALKCEVNKADTACNEHIKYDAEKKYKKAKALAKRAGRICTFYWATLVIMTAFFFFGWLRDCFKASYRTSINQTARHHTGGEQ